MVAVVVVVKGTKETRIVSKSLTVAAAVADGSRYSCRHCTTAAVSTWPREYF